MSTERLFGNNIRPACKYCGRIFQILDNDRIICNKNGIVSADSKCRHFFYDPLRRVPHRPKPLEKFEKSDFDIE